jgi:hypothetical protein
VRPLSALVFLLLSSPAFSGCLDNGNNLFSSPEWSVLDEQEMFIERGQYFSLKEIEGHEQYKWELKYNSEHDFDVYFLDDKNCQKWDIGEPVLIISALSWEGMNSDGDKGPSYQDSSKTYCWIIDNSDKGNSSPPLDGDNGPIHVSFTFYSYS